MRSLCQDCVLTRHSCLYAAARLFAIRLVAQMSIVGGYSLVWGAVNTHQNDIDNTQHAIFKACLRHEPRATPTERHRKAEFIPRVEQDSRIPAIISVRL